MQSRAEMTRELIKNILMCCIICSITLFVSSRRFVNAEVTPKWLCLMLCLGFMGMVWSVFNHKTSIKNNQSKIVNYLYGTVIVFALTLAIQGIFQYAGVLPSGNYHAVTGSFDNPAGFAAALVCALPLCFLFFTDKTKYLKYAAIAAAALMAIAIFLSGSRAGMVAMAVAMAVWFLAKPRYLPCFQRHGRFRVAKIILLVVLVVLPLILYFFKKDSADGRLLIWRCTLDMVADKPVFGHGHSAFQAKYMLYQAAYLNAHPNSKYAQLADNTIRPFNEYLLILSEYGIVGLSAVALIGFFLVRTYRRKSPPPLEGDRGEAFVALMSLLALSVFSFFSYPFRYPFTWVMLFVILLGFQNPAGFTQGYVRRFIQNLRPAKFWKHSRSIVRVVVFLLSAGLLTYTVMLTRAEITWNRIARQSLAGQTLKVLPEYDKLYPLLGKNGLFLYNHAAELHEAKEYEKSVAVFERCTRYYNDMDVQILLADNYKELGKYPEAEQCLKLAAAMCPARFMPLYELVRLYDAADRKDEALALAKKIIDKDVKIPSHTVTAIKNEMRQLIEAQETSDETESNNPTNNEPINNKTRQGETPEVQPHGAALPP